MKYCVIYCCYFPAKSPAKTREVGTKKGREWQPFHCTSCPINFRADLAALQVAIQAQFVTNQNNQAIQAQIDFHCILLEDS